MKGSVQRAPSKTPARNGDVYPPFYQKMGSLPAFVREGDMDYPFEDTGGAGDENKIRGNWSSHLDALLAALGFSFGFGKLWRFPFYCYANGGVAFLIPYTLFSVLFALPLLLMEFCLGQFSSLGCLSVWKVCPLFKGVGVAMFLVSCCVAIYQNIVTAWAIHFVVSSVRTALPWANCENEWNTAECAVWTKALTEKCENKNGTLLGNGTCLSEELASAAGIFAHQFTEFPKNRSLPSHEFFHREVLKMSEGPGEVGSIYWQLALYLLVAWLLVFLVLFKGIKSAGKVVYVTTLVPILVLLVFFVRALFLDGATNGLREFLAPDWSKLLLLKTWGDAGTQSIYSLGCSWGVYITMASYNRFHNNCYRDAWVITIADLLGSFYTAIVTYAVLGFIGTQLQNEFQGFLDKEPGLAFVIFAEAIARLPIAPIWSILFFLILILLTLDTVAFVVETVVTGLCDEFPERLRRNHRHVLSLLVFIFYAAGVALCTQAGMYYLRLMDYYAITWTLLLIAFFQVMAIAWVYGVDNLLDNAKWMIGWYPPIYLYWKILWKLILPSALLGMMVYTWVSHSPLEYQGVPYPRWANLGGWALSFIPVLAIPATALFRLFRSKGICSKRIQDLMSPEEDWGPALAIHRAEQFPLQIPEARRPVRPPKNEEPLDRLLDSQEDFVPEEPVRSLSPAQIPHFDRETAI